MATRKTARKRTPKKTMPRRKTAAQTAKTLPQAFADYVDQAHTLLDRIEREIVKAGTRTRREAARRLREASHELGRIEARGEREWRRLSKRARGEAVRLLENLRATIAAAPVSKTRRRVG